MTPRSSITALSALALCASAEAQSNIYVLEGSAGEGLGDALSACGDINGDGVDDFALGARGAAGGRGLVRWVSGSSGLALREVVGQTSGDEFGAALASAGDLDGDGRDELLVGAPGTAPGGAAWVLSGADGSTLRTWLGATPGARFGTALAALGDLDGDGVGDFAVGAPLDDGAAGSDCGSVRVISGASGATLRTHFGTLADQLCGHAVAALGDLDGDGRREIAVGEPVDFATTSNLPGRVRVFSGASGAQRFVWGGLAARDHFGSSVADAGDVDGDGVRDVAVGAPQWSASGKGYVRVHSGASGALVWSAAGDSAGDRFGSALACAGDVDGDGRAELWIGAPQDDAGGLDSGSAWLYSSAGASMGAVFGRSILARLGTALAGACDLNADARPDALIGSPGEQLAGAGAGAVHAVSSSATTLAVESHLLSLSQGAPLLLDFSGGAPRAGQRYIVLGSIHGTLPGVIVGGLHVPVNPGRYLEYTSRALPNGIVSQPAGLLDGGGHASATFRPWLSPSWPALVGLTFHHVVVVTDAQNLPVFVSNPVPITLTP